MSAWRPEIGAWVGITALDGTVKLGKWWLESLDGGRAFCRVDGLPAQYGEWFPVEWLHKPTPQRKSKRAGEGRLGGE